MRKRCAWLLGLRDPEALRRNLAQGVSVDTKAKPDFYIYHQHPQNMAHHPFTTAPHPTYITPLPPKITNILPLRYPPTQSYYMDGSFTPYDGQGNGNIVSSGIFNTPLAINIVAKLLSYPNILRAELYALLLAIEHTKKLTIDTFIFTNNLNNIYLLLNHIRHPSSQYNHLDKLLIALIIDAIRDLHS